MHKDIFSTICLYWCVFVSFPKSLEWYKIDTEFIVATVATLP